MRKQYPVDADRLVKGAMFTIEELEDITGMKRGTQEYAFALLKLKQDFRRLAQRSGMPPIVPRIDHGSIRICEDNEASDYTHRRFQSGLAVAALAHRDALGVNVDNLTADEAKTHERRVLVQGAMLVGATNARKKLEPKARERNTPGLLE